MATLSYPMSNNDSKARVIFRSYVWNVNNRPNLANTKDLTKKGGAVDDIRLYLPGAFTESYGAEWGEEEVMQAATNWSEDFIKGVGVDALKAGVKTLNGMGLTGAVSTGKFLAGETEFPGAFLVFKRGSPVSLSFTFDMIPKNAQEGQTIKQIVDTFKKQILPTFRGVVLNFPNIWVIAFKGIKGPGFPDSGDFYDFMALTKVVPTYGGGTNSALVFEDGIPVSTQLQLEFTSIKHSYLT